MEQIRPAQSIIACGPMQDTKRFFRRAMYRKFTDVEMVEHEAELRARIAEEPPEGVLLCLPEPDCSRVTAWLRAEYPEIRLCSVTEQDRLLVNCPWSATYLPLPPPLTWERAGQAMYWFGYKEEGQPESSTSMSSSVGRICPAHCFPSMERICASSVIIIPLTPWTK